jgi:hypothetical protein
MVTLNEVWIPSQHYSSSRGPYNKIVFHTTEGAMKIRDLGAWFQNPAAGCSSHHGADNYERGVFGAYVYENHKAWTQGNANDYCLSLEQCAYASWSRDTWLNSKGVLIDNSAQWLRYMVDKYAIPWTLLNDSQAQNPSARGICEHVNLGSWGSGHHDCGSGFPMDVVIDKAKKWGGGSPSGGGQDMIPGVAVYDNKDYYAWVGKNGVIRYRGPDTNNQPVTIDSTASASGGCGMVISDGGWTFVTFTNAQGDPYVLRRAEGGEGGWQRFRLEDV